MSTTRHTPYAYETVAASQTAQVLGPGVGATGDEIRGLYVIPSATTVGAISILDNATSITVYAGGTVGADLKPFNVELWGIKSQSGAWKVTTGAGATVIAVGRFS